jgi:calcium/calmodulin-dependent protein kinase I
VKEGVHVEDGAKCAVKIVDKQGCGSQEGAALTELAVLQHLSAGALDDPAAHSASHPSRSSLQRFLWQWGAVYEDEARLYIMMELLRGGELLNRVIDGPGALPEAGAAAVMAQLLRALDELHGRGVIHRDVKPENLLFRSEDADSGVVLTDFGLSLVVGQPDLIPEAAGTFGYAAPEVLEERHYSPACDVWSAGVVAYVILCGQMPFVWLGCDDYTGLLRRHLVEARRGPRFDTMAWQGRKLSSLAQDFISQMLQHPLEPARRPTPGELLNHEWLQLHGVAAGGGGDPAARITGKEAAAD